LTRKIALITGGSRGIGKEIALALAKEGNNIAISYGNNSESAMEVVKEIQSFGVEAIAVKADVSIAEDVKNLIKAVEEGLGTIDILVNNAGITKDNLLIRMTEEDWDNVMDVNLKGVFLCTKAVSRSMMKKRYGKIINITSVVGITGNAGQGNYSASKAGVIGFTKSMAKELASRGIRVNAVAPGLTRTDMAELMEEKAGVSMMRESAMGRLANPAEIAEVLKEYIIGHFNEEISLNQIAHNMNYSCSYLTKIFYQQYECTPTKYLISLRMQKAQQLLTHHTELSIRQIGEAVGYPEQGYFSRIFKKQNGSSPLEYREEKEAQS